MRDKLTIFKSARTRFTDHIKMNRNYRQAEYKDGYLEALKRGGTKLPFA